MQCLKNKSLIGFGLIAAMLAGCQTAQTKHETIDASFLAVPSDYGADRTPAGGGPFDDLMRLLSRDGEKELKNGAKIGDQYVKEAYRAVNNSKDPEIIAARKALGEDISEANIGSVDPKLQAKLVDELSHLKIFRTKFGFVQEYKEIATRAKAIMSSGAKGGAEELRTTSTFSRSGLLSTGMKAEKGKTYAPEVLDRFYLRNVTNDALSANAEIYGKNVKVDDAGSVVVGRLNKEGKMEYLPLAEAERAGLVSKANVDAIGGLVSTTKSARDYQKLTGRSILDIDTCKNLDPEAMKKYKDLLDNHIASVPKDGKVCPELEAWVAARFQMDLGREGLSAWTSAAELAVCKFERAETGRAANKLAAQYHGTVPDRAPACK